MAPPPGAPTPAHPTLRFFSLRFAGAARFDEQFLHANTDFVQRFVEHALRLFEKGEFLLDGLVVT
jgi:hypothetical protein